MCAIILKVLYLGGLVFGVALTCVALATTYWRHLDDTVHAGLFKTCINDPTTKKDYVCGDTWKEAPAWRRAVVGCLAFAVALSLLAIGWWMLACIGCCCQGWLAPPLPLFALLLLILDLIAAIIYPVMWSKEENLNLLTKDGYYGWSYWCLLAAVGAFALTVLIGCGVVAYTSKHGHTRTAYREI